MRLNGALHRISDIVKSPLINIHSFLKIILFVLSCLVVMDFNCKVMAKIFSLRSLIFIFINVIILILVISVKLKQILICFLKIFKFKLLLTLNKWILINMEKDLHILSKIKFSIYTQEQWMVKLYK